MKKDDVISRQAAIDAICMEWCGVKHQDCKHPFDVEKDDYYWCDGCETALRTLPDLPPAQQWIPCSDKMPKIGKDVLVCYEFKGHRSVLIGCLYSDNKFHGYDDEYLTPEGRKYRHAVAWMPLPEPWKGE